MSKLRIAIIGCGRMGRERARSAQLHGAQVAAVYDVERQRALELAGSAEILYRPDEFPRARVDAVFVCAPPNCRTQPILAAIDAGVPFFVEKPVGTSCGAVQTITAALERSHVINAVGYMNRYRSSVQAAKSVLSQTQPIGVSAHWVCREYGVPWLRDGSTSGGPHNDQATHLFDLCRYLIGEVTEVHTISQSPDPQCSLAASTALRFRCGITGTVHYTCQAQAKDIGLRVFTRAGSLYLDGWDFQLTANSVGGAVLPSAAAEDIFALETQAFLEAVRNHQPDRIRSDWADAIRTQRLMDATAASCIRSAAMEAGCGQ